MSAKLALAGLAALGGVALMAPAASAMPNGMPAAATQASGVENVRWVCGPYRCWWQPPRFYRPYAYYAPPRPFYRPWRHHRRW